MKLEKHLVCSNGEASEKTNHVVCIDCSGSMCEDLPLIRRQLKNKLTQIVQIGDTVSLVWFSGKGESGCLAEFVEVNGVAELGRLNTAIDRWLNPVGMTGFVEPLHEVLKLCMEKSDGAYSLFFMTDGCDNQSDVCDIMGVCGDLRDVVSNATFVEYGYCCDHDLLTKMADEIGGKVVFASGFDEYNPLFEGTFSEKSGRKVKVCVGEPKFGLVFAPTETGAVSYKVVDGHVCVPETAGCVYAFADGDWDEDEADFPALYQGLALLAGRREGKFVREALTRIGDKRMFGLYANCFGKQALYSFQKEMVAAGNDEKKRFAEGKSQDLRVDVNAYTVVDFLSDVSDCGCKVDLSSLKYNRIGRKTEIDTRLSEEERTELADAIANAGNSEELADVMERARAIRASKGLKFKQDSEVVPVGGITWNSSRANASLLFKIDGTVDLGDCAPSGVPSEFKTHVYRNYAVVKDGIVNIDVFPLIPTKEVHAKLSAAGLVKESFEEGRVYEVVLKGLPIVNESMVGNVSAAEFAASQFELFRRSADKKVCKAFLEKTVGETRSAGIEERYGAEAAGLLASIGLTDSGFSPKTVQSEPTDCYTACEMTAKFKGFSTIPSYNALVKKLMSGKSLTPAERLLKPKYDECLANEAAMDRDGFVKWLCGEIEAAEADIAKENRKLVAARFSVIVGQTWFSEFHDTENCKYDFKYEGGNVEVTFSLSDTEVKI